MFFIFLFKQGTAYGQRISDWSSDVCSSDLRSTTCSRALRRKQCRTSTWPSAFPRPKASHWNDLLPPLRRPGVRKAVCEPLARGLTSAIELGSMAGRVGEGCFQERPEPWAPPPSLPRPSQGDGPHPKPAAEAPTRREEVGVGKRGGRG